MKKIICDICNREITDTNNYARYKLKKETHGFTESWFYNLDVHETCWRDLTQVFANKRKLEEKDKNAR